MSEKGSLYSESVGTPVRQMVSLLGEVYQCGPDV